MQSVEIKQAPTGPVAPEQETSNGGQQQGGDRPQWLDPKFKSPEDLAKAYNELSKKLGEQQKAPEQPNDQQSAADQQKAADDAVAKAGLDFNTLSQYYAEHGTLSEEHYKALSESAGVPKNYVDAFIAGQIALANQVRANVFEVAGGEDGYGAMVTWAASNLTPQQIAAYNAATESNDMAQVMLAVNGLKAQYEKANGSEGQYMGGAHQSQNSGYRSWAEVTRDMNDPRYQSDPAFRADVERKMALTKSF